MLRRVGGLTRGILKSVSLPVELVCPRDLAVITDHVFCPWCAFLQRDVPLGRRPSARPLAPLSQIWLHTKDEFVNGIFKLKGVAKSWDVESSLQ